jgi:hypothetical protein
MLFETNSAGEKGVRIAPACASLRELVYAAPNF